MKYVLGIDVGGTKIAAGLVDRSFRVKQVSVLPTSQTDLAGQLTRLIEDYKGFDAIGLALPGRVLENGLAPRLPNVRAYKPINFKLLFKKKFRCPVYVMNDSKAFALAEAIVGAGRNAKTVVGVILGTGIGSGLISNKKVYTGSNYVAGEIGRIELGNNLTLEQVMQQGGSMGPLIRKIIIMLIRTVDPDMIVFGGGRMKDPKMVKIVQQSFKTALHYPVKTAVKISKLKHAALIGAALPLLKK